MIEIISKNPDFSDYADILREKYGFDKSQAGLVKLMTVEDLLSADKYRQEAEKMEEKIKWYKKERSSNT
jgi:hypothetical protein